MGGVRAGDAHPGSGMILSEPPERSVLCLSPRKFGKFGKFDPSSEARTTVVEELRRGQPRACTPYLPLSDQFERGGGHTL